MGPAVPGQRHHLIDSRRPIVYYVRTRDLIKIGRTIMLRRRMLKLRPDELLAVEPGGPEVESLRHRQFAQDRVRVGTQIELFRPSARLLQHIAECAAAFPPPSLAEVLAVPRDAVCNSGHQLVGPNVQRSRSGGITCSTCFRVQVRSGFASRRGEAFDYEAERARVYAEIMGGSR